MSVSELETPGAGGKDAVSAAFLAASDRLAALQPQREEIYRLLAERSLRFLDPERLAKRVDRLLRNPLVEKLLQSRGVAEELRRGAAVGELSREAQSELERVLDGSDFMPVWFLTRGAELRRTVGLVRARTAAGREAAGTGFLVGPRLLLTNFHVLDWTDIGQRPLAELVRHSLVEFDFEEGSDGRRQPVATFRLDPATLLLASSWDRLDYVLVALEPLSLEGVAIDDFGYNRLAGDLGKISTGESVFIIQHARGEAKQVVVQNNRLFHIADVGTPVLSYEADTDHGSSGAPVYNRQWEVVALHHSTQIARDAQGRTLARDGGLWQPGMGSDQVQYLNLNEGVRISRILAELAAKATEQMPLAAPEALSAAGRPLLAKALETHLGASPMDLVAPIPAETVGPLPASPVGPLPPSPVAPVPASPPVTPAAGAEGAAAPRRRRLVFDFPRPD